MPKRFLLIAFIVLISYLSVFASTVKLEVLSHPSGADIFIDRVWRGTTPQVLYIAPGKHQIQLEKFGYSPSTEEFDLRLSSVAEYNLTPEREITKNYPLVIYLVNYQSAGDRTVLYKEQEKELVQALWNRFTNMGFNVTIETPKDEFDLVLDKESIYLDIEKKYPQSGMFFFIDSLWTFSSFQQKRVTRLETTLKVYDPKSKVTLGTFKDTAESVGQMSPDIVVLEIVERITQNFLDNIGNFLVQIYTKQTNTPILLSKIFDRDVTTATIKNLSPIENLEVVDFSNNLLKTEVNTALDSGINILFVVDRSGSNTKYSEVIKQQMDLILKNLPKRIRWGILAFDDKVEVIQSFTEDYSRWTAAKEKITNAGMTRLHDGLFNAAKIMEREQGVNVIILLTDGIDADYLDAAPGSIKSKKEGIDALKTAGVVVYPVGISEKNFTNFMKELALEFGTFYSDSFRHNNEKIATDILQDIVQSIAIVKTARIDNPSFYINGRKFYLSVNGRNLLNQEMIDMAVYKTAYGDLSIPVESHTTPAVPILPVEPVDTIATAPGTLTALATLVQETTAATAVAVDFSTSTDAVMPPATVTADTRLETSEQPTKTVPDIAVTSPVPVPQATVTSEALIQAIQWPEGFNQALELRFSELYDLDPHGHFVWTERSTGYLWIRDQMKLLGIDLKEMPVMIDLCYPYLAVL
ncbi:MAG: VWA domain-containing protein [Thermotogaceae bacterium]|nr:VWA domain-containing protein [Thermotogaceae bacterium]